MRFFNGPKEFTMTLLILMSAYLTYKSSERFNKIKFLYIALLIALMGIFSAHKTSKYMMLYLPFFVLLVTKAWLLLARRSKELPPWNTMAFLLLLITYVIVNSIFNVRLSAKKFFAADTKELLSTYIKEDFSTLNIVAPMTYIFNNIGDFRRIHADLYYSQAYTKQHKDFSTEATNFNIDYIFLENYHSERSGIPALKKNDTLGNYIVLDRLPDLTILHKFIDKKNEHSTIR
jgi:Ca2+/Na+ antiporter